MKTRNFVMFCLVAFFLMGASCKKKVEEQYDDLIKKLLVDGTWIMTKYTENSIDYTTMFNGWVFKFNDNNTVTATKASTIETGTWNTNITNQTMTGQFPNTVGDPLQRLNGTWNITSTSPTVEKLTQTKNGIVYVAEMTKN